MSSAPMPLLFDLDGTLVDSLPDIAASANHLRASFGLPEASLDDMRGMVGDGLITLLRRALAGHADMLDDDAFEAAIDIYRAHYTEQCTKITVPFEGVPECLARWHAVGHPMAVVTNKPERFARRILSHLDLSQWLPVVIGGDTLDVRKPDPLPIFAALDQLGVERSSVGRERALMIGDSICDIEAGKNAGIRTAAALFGYQPEAALRAAGADEYWPRFGVELHDGSRQPD